MKTCISFKRLGAPVRVCTSVVAVLSTFSALAAENAVTFSEVVVTASRNAQLLSSALPHTTVITREDIARAQVSDLVTLLQREAGLQRTQNGGIGTVASVFVRGAPSLQTLVLIDGVVQNKQDASGAVSLEHLMLDNIERVEIVRGNVSAIYGSGAIGGVIQIFTKSAGQQPTADVSVEAGPRSTKKISGDIQASFAATSLSVGLSRLLTDGFSSLNPAQFSGANPDADAYANTSAHVSLVHQLAPAHSFGMRLTHTEANTNYDNAFGASTDLQSSKTRLSQATLFSDNTWGQWRSRVNLSTQSDDSTTHDNGFFGSNDGFTTRATVLNWVNTIAVQDVGLFTGGLEHQRQHVDTKSDSAFVTPYNRERNADAVFAGFEGALGRTSFQLNVRHDRVGDLRKNTGFLGLGYSVTEQIKMTASTSTAFNAPPLGYLFAPGFGNPLLRPEKAHSHEFGAQFESSSQFLRATYFDTRIQDQLDFDFVTSAFANIGRTRNSGWELSYRGNVAGSDVRASLTVQDPINKITQQRLTRRAQTMASFGVSHAIGAWRLGADLQYAGDRPDAYSDPVTFAKVETTLASYTTLDMTLAYRVSPTVQLKARLDNATDKNYQTVYGYNQQPRSLYLGLTWSPKL